jgi:light-regulated signal transduction histidine kinase (bacteriophytochrome)
MSESMSTASVRGARRTVSRRGTGGRAPSPGPVASSLQRKYDELVAEHALVLSKFAQQSEQFAAVQNELETFVHAVSHDLRAPLRTIQAYSELLREDSPLAASDECQKSLFRIIEGAKQINGQLELLLRICRLQQQPLVRQPLDLGSLASEIVVALKKADPRRQVQVSLASPVLVNADATLLRLALQHLLENAWKFTARTPNATIELGCKIEAPRKESIVFVRDNGAGFNMQYVDRLFGLFQRLHPPDEFHGSGVGLAVVKRIVHRHGGRVWAEGAIDRGATFYFSI